MEGRITLRLSKSGQQLFKSKSYEIRLNGKIIGHIDTKKNTITEQLPMGKYMSAPLKSVTFKSIKFFFFSFYRIWIFWYSAGGTYPSDA
ncbi:MAG: hypothetical protein IM449_10630 [Microcystis sp. M065S1]|nr:hypothetical protein [Microcystis sp. M065S1]